MQKTFNDIFESFGSIMELLKNEKFQDLLVNYERAKKIFFVGYEVKDDVDSMILFEAEGRYGLKPEDYLIAFSEFIRKKEKEIQAISILLNKPKEWSTKALNELRRKLRENDYAETDLQKAHKIVYHKDTVDIISMVKHAAKETEKLLSINERVESAILKVVTGKNLNDEQQKWLEYIKEHLKQNLSIDDFDFEEQPVFADHGGLKKFKKVFPGVHEMIISEINNAIAA